MPRPSPVTLSEMRGTIWKGTYRGGEGVSIAATDASSRAVIPGMATSSQPNVLAIYNDSEFSVFVRLGADDVVATTASYPIPPGAQIWLPTFSPQYKTPTHIAAVTRGAGETANVIVSPGFGNT